MQHWYRNISSNDEVPVHWWYDLPSPYPADPDARVLSGLPQESVISAAEGVCFLLPGVKWKYSVSDLVLRLLELDR